MKRIQYLNPTDENFAKISCIQAFAECYGADMEDLGYELHQAKRLLERSAKDTNFINASTILSFLSFQTPFKAAFHELHRLCKIAISLSSAQHRVNVVNAAFQHRDRSKPMCVTQWLKPD